MVSAYERTKPFCTAAQPRDMPPIAAAVPFTAPSMPVSSNRTRPSVSCWPGSHEHGLVERVAVQVVAAGQR